MKVAPIVDAMKRREREFTPLIVHTGQHYDSLMSDAFFHDLELPAPDVHLGVGSASHAAQTAAVMERFEPVVLREKPDWVLVVGDVNSTLACALVCSKLGVAGKDYAVLTLHRPANVDDRETFARILRGLEEIATRLPIVFPVHPRTKKTIAEFGFGERIKKSNLSLIAPMPYLDFLGLYSGARLVLTDSGGIQEETTFLGIPCLTLRETTERPITVEMGTNTVAGSEPKTIVEAARRALEHPPDKTSRRIPPLWDGHTADRILDALIEKDEMRDEG